MLGLVSATALLISQGVQAEEKNNMEIIGYVSGVIALDKYHHQLIIMDAEGHEAVMKIDLPLGIDPNPVIPEEALGIDPNPVVPQESWGIDPNPVIQ